MTVGANYSVDEWAEISEGDPLAGLSARDLPVMHRHYMWADHQRRAFDPQMASVNAENLHEQAACALFLWFGLL